MRSAKLDCEVAVIGAGPYGLAAAALLRANGCSAQVLGIPMEFWRHRMPAGMLLRSAREASNIADPAGALTLDRYAAERGTPVPSPIPLADYLGYGEWFQSIAVPAVDRRRVSRVALREGGGFMLQLHDGDSLETRRVIHAAGLEQFAWRPAAFASLPANVCSHASDRVDLRSFRDSRVLVVGAGQSALESAALLAEGGATVELLARADSLRWLRGGALRRRLGPLRPLFYPSTDVGPPGLNHLMARPLVLQRVPARLRERASVRSVRPAGADWLRERLAGVTVTLGAHATEAAHSGEGVEVRLSDGTTRKPDHVVLGTGYRVDVRRCRLLDPGIVGRLERDGGFPRLTRGFESSVRDLHFVGAAASGSYGPLMKFVSGTRFASRELGARVSGPSRRMRPGLARPPVPPPASHPPPAPASTRHEPATTR